MFSIARGRYVARFAQGEADIRRAQVLRWLCFIAARSGAAPEGRDCDVFDSHCLHVLIEDRYDGRLLCCFRMLPLAGGAEVSSSYSAQYYDLSALTAYDGPMLEIGRFCMAPGLHDPDVLRLAWAMLTRFVDSRSVRMLFGCSSFMGTDWAPYRDSFAALAQGHLAPARWRPRVKAPRVIRYVQDLAGRPVDPRLAALRMPPLLRSYLAMGGWVSDHAVVDLELQTLHVFTGLEICAIPPARAWALRLVAGRGGAAPAPAELPRDI